jgi:hypothetical protein
MCPLTELALGLYWSFHSFYCDIFDAVLITSWLAQAATKSCFNAGMAANRNFAEVSDILREFVSHVMFA